MKVVILAGGLGTRISEETQTKPKPMVQIGDKPILWHIMKIYSYFGYNEFIICLGYKGEVIKEYFANYVRNHSNVTFEYPSGRSQFHNIQVEPWKVTLIDTGSETMTGGRIKRIQPYVGDEPFMLTYGDGLCDVSLKDLEAYHKSHGRLATVTAVQPAGRFGALSIEEDGTVNRFNEKMKGDGKWVNGGFFVLQPEVFDYLTDDTTVFEQEPLVNLAAGGQLRAYRHDGFWYAMDTLRDKNHLQSLWSSRQAPWKVW
ncbi:glucose-1-phosphate cytidylyltransferase [Paenibacillus antibioticophila]|uniref:glucose-1-phosphate cytidylyltransferase n=1 Tax=Paenibacillus antibioticophila TaxID=1274374 RepID=UPI0005C8C72F|nr:glucose-1-phosphate cytidylyltransferase [Paenibacillus antibioticophila]